MPETVWVQHVSTAHPEETIHVIAAVPAADSGFALVRITGPNIRSVIEAMEDHDQITELSLAQWGDNEATVHFRTTAPLLLFSSRDAGMPIELPIEIQNGEALIEVTGSRDRFSELVDQLESFGFEYRIEHIRERLYSGQLLSERQQEAVVTAVRHGYYDTPRRCSLTELADHLDIAKSTCSETLHRAEEKIIKQFIENLPEYDESSLTNQLATKSSQ